MRTASLSTRARCVLPFALLALPVTTPACSSSSATATTEAGVTADSGTSTDAFVAKDAGFDGATHDAGTDVGVVHPSDAGIPDVGTLSTPEASTHDAGTHDTGAHDAGNAKDVSTGDPGSTIASCAGTSMTLTVSNEQPYVDVPVGAQKGQFVMDYGSNFSSIDLSAFATLPQTTGCNTNDVGGLCNVADFAFFTSPMTEELTAENYSDVTGTVRQAGILGTDLLGNFILTLRYGAGLVHASSAASFCSTSALTSAGFVALSTTGFFTNDTTSLEPLTDVDDAGDSEYTVPDVPTVMISLAGVKGLAQLDTGFADSAGSFSVNINAALFSAVDAAHPGALVRDASLDETLTTCEEGVSQQIKGYTLASGEAFAFLGAGGAVARSYGNATIFLKETPEGAVDCGGIGTWSVPAAQVGASFYVGMQTVVFDPFGARVWIPKD